MKAVLISIHPKWVEKIASGEKTIKVCKTRPTLETPFKCYIYCTYGNPKDNYCLGKRGEVIGEFVCDRIEKFSVFENGAVQYWNYYDLEKSCLTYDEISNYIGKNKQGYGWHISNLKIYDKPKELSEFWSADKCPYASTDGCTYKYYCFRAGQTKRCGNTLKRPPQSWCYVEGGE